MSPPCLMRAVSQTLAIVLLFSHCQGSDDDQPCHRAASPSGVAFCEEKFGTLNKWVCTDQTCPLIRIQKRGCVTLDLMQLAGYQPNDLCVFDPGDWMTNDETGSSSDTSEPESESGTTSNMSTTSDSSENTSGASEIGSTSTGSDASDSDSEATSDSGDSTSSTGISSSSEG